MSNSGRGGSANALVSIAFQLLPLHSDEMTCLLATTEAGSKSMARTIFSPRRRAVTAWRPEPEPISRNDFVERSSLPITRERSWAAYSICPVPISEEKALQFSPKRKCVPT